MYPHSKTHVSISGSTDALAIARVKQLSPISSPHSPIHYYNSTYSPGNSSYSYKSTPSTSTYFESNGGISSGVAVIFVLVGIFFVVGMITALVRSYGGCSNSHSSQPPPARIISTIGVNNVYPNHVIDLSSQNNYVQMASTPQYQQDMIPLAVAVPSAPSAPSASDDLHSMVTVQIDTFSHFDDASERAYEPQGPVIAIGSLPAAKHPAIVATRLPFDELTVHVLISKGRYGRVYKGTYRGETVAIKKLLPEAEKDLVTVTAFLHEIKLTAMLHHPNLVQYIGVSWDDLRELCAVTEFMEGGDLRTALTQLQTLKRPQGFDSQKATIAMQVAQALAYLHSQYPEVLHRNLKSKNILLDKTKTLAKVAGFGVTREHGMVTAIGSLLWMAPEVMTGERYDEKADVFSFGVVLSELDTHAMPYGDAKAKMVSESGRPLPDSALLQRIMTGRVSVSFSDALGEDVKALATSCLSLDPRNRPSASQVVYEIEAIQRRVR